MAYGRIIPVDTLQQLLSCDPKAGLLIWRARPRGMFSDLRSFQAWNARYAGKEAFTSLSHDGYRQGTVLGHGAIRAHRVIFALATGAWPKGHLDHINGDKIDNRMSNIRNVTPSQNLRNSRRYRHNTSGVNGVHWDKRAKRWVARIRADGKNCHLGYFDNLAAAAVARGEANRLHGYTERHGK